MWTVCEYFEFNEYRLNVLFNGWLIVENIHIHINATVTPIQCNPQQFNCCAALTGYQFP